MRPLTQTRPKVMLPVAGRPIMEHLLLEMRAAGVPEFVFIVGYRDDRVREYFGGGEKWGVRIEYRFQPKATGTAAALNLARDAVSGPFLVVNGDSIFGRDDISQLVGLAGNQIAVKEVEHPEGFGVVEVNDGCLSRIHEKSARPPSRLANAGLYLFTPDIFEATAGTAISPRGEYELPAAIELLASKGHRVGCYQLELWLEMSYPWDLLSVNEALMAEIKTLNNGVIEGNVAIRGAVQLGDGSRILSGSYISGPVIIGRNCVVGPNCYLRAATVIGDGCHIGAGVEIKNSIIMSGTKIPHLSYIGDSVIGENCNLGAGTKVANLRLDKRDVVARGMSTHRRKLGAIIGDGVQSGINASINTGTIIGDNAWIGPGALAKGNIAPGSRVF